MTDAELILADARAESQRTGEPVEHLLAAWCAALAKGLSEGYMRAGRPTAPARDRREAHPETKLEGEP